MYDMTRNLKLENTIRRIKVGSAYLLPIPWRQPMLDDKIGRAKCIAKYPYYALFEIGGMRFCCTWPELLELNPRGII